MCLGSSQYFSDADAERQLRRTDEKAAALVGHVPGRMVHESAGRRLAAALAASRLGASARNRLPCVEKCGQRHDLGTAGVIWWWLPQSRRRRADGRARRQRSRTRVRVQSVAFATGQPHEELDFSLFQRQVRSGQRRE